MSLKKQAASSGWLNPFPTKDLPGIDPSMTKKEVYEEKRKIQDMVQSAAKVGLGWAGVLFASRLALYGLEKAQKSDRVDELKAYTNAKYPRINLDPNSNDTALEEAQRAEGIPAFKGIPELKKSAAELERSPYAPVMDPLKDLYQSFARTDVSPLHIAAALSAAIGGGYFGWNTADKLVDRMRSKALDKRIAKDRNELDKLMFEEYRRTRGMDKGASVLFKDNPEVPEWAKDGKPVAGGLADPTPEEMERIMLFQALRSQEWDKQEKLLRKREKLFRKAQTPTTAKEAAEKNEAPETSVWHGLKSLYPVYFAAALALAYTTSRNYADQNDPNRQRVKQLKAFAKERAKMTDAPMLLNDTDFGSGEGVGAKKGRVRTGIALPSGNSAIAI